MKSAKSLGKGSPRHPRETGPTHIKDLVPDPANRRAHNPRNLGMVVDALQQVGAARSIVIDEDNVILAGNGVTEAAGEAGITKVRVVEASGDEIIAVRRRGLTADQKRALAIFDNRAAELADWNAEQLQADVDAGLTLEPWFSEDEARVALRAPADPGPEAAQGGGSGPGFQYSEQYGVIVLCANEDGQRATYEQLTGLGLTCKVVTT